MNRLTKRCNGVVTYIGASNEYETGQIACEVSPQGVRELLDRLAAFEDTETEPEEIAAMRHTLDEYVEAAEAEAIGIAVGGEVYNLPGGTAIPDAPEALAQEGEAEEYVFRNHARIIENEEATNAAFVAMEEAMCDMDSSSEERLTAVEEALCELDSAANGGGENG